MTNQPEGAPGPWPGRFVWQAHEVPVMGSIYKGLPESQVAGMMKNPMNGAPSCWLAHFFTPDLAASTSKAKELGAKALMENAPIPEVGAFTLLDDPVGATFALLQAAPGIGDC
ncbi:MAG TPA: VOC family protein [bacterium]|nr:VOC family protein [bacterium]